MARAKTAKRRTRNEIRVDLAEPEIEGKEISIEAIKPGMHENAEGIISDTVWRVNSGHRHRNLLSRLFSISDVYVKLPADIINVPENAARQIAKGRKPDETAVFISTQLGNSSVDAFLAARYSGHWREIYRWRTGWNELGISRRYICEF